MPQIKFDYRYILLLAFPAALLAQPLGLGEIAQFVLSAIAIIPLAGFIGEATEEMAAYTGPRVGGLLNATLGNAAELIITIIAIREGILELVLASITGSILGNLLLVMGLALLLGGIRHGTQRFNSSNAGGYATMLILAVAAITVPAIFAETISAEHNESLQTFSLGIAVVMILIYLLGLYYNLFTKDERSPLEREPAHVHEATWSLRRALIVLAIATIGIVVMSELLVETVEHTAEVLGWSTFFIGIIIVPLVGNVAEHMVAVQVALKDKMDLSLEIAISSSLQIALFVAPVLMFVAALMGQPLSFSFNRFELVTLAAAAIVAAFIVKDGKSNWLEGAQLLALYAIIAVAFFFL